MSNWPKLVWVIALLACAIGAWTMLSGEKRLSAEIRSKSGEFDATVAAEVWMGIHFANMNAGAVLEVSGTSSDKVPVYLLAGTQDSFELGKGEVLVALISENSFEFTTTIPADGDYMLVLDNREGKTPIDYKIDANASLKRD